MILRELQRHTRKGKPVEYLCPIVETIIRLRMTWLEFTCEGRVDSYRCMFWWWLWWWLMVQLLIRVLFISRIYGFISETPECCPWYLSVGIRLFQDSLGWFRGSCGYQFSDFPVMMVIYPSIPFISELLSWICGYIFPQMVVISSEAVTQCSGCSDDLEDGTVHCIHTSASFTFCIYLHLTHVYPYAGDILDRDPGWETSLFQTWGPAWKMTSSTVSSTQRLVCWEIW